MQIISGLNSLST